MGVVKKNDSTLGIDVGGTKIYAARYDGDSSVLHETTCRTQAKKGKDVVLDSLQKAIAEVFDPSVSAIGVSWAGLVDSQNGIICNSPNIIGFEDHSIKNTIEQWFGVPVFVENDARLFVFAEQRIGSARGAENVLGLILGTGVGSGIVINGKIYSGSSGFAGEIGHSFFSLDDSPRIEEWLSGTALKKILASHGKSPHLFENIHGCSNQDEIVDAMYHQWAEHLSRFVINLVLAYDPKVIVFGGGVGIHILPHFLPFVRERVNTFFEQKNYPFSFDLRISTQKNAGALGAALYAKENS